jgi:hypothetical protein
LDIYLLVSLTITYACSLKWQNHLAQVLAWETSFQSFRETFGLSFPCRGAWPEQRTVCFKIFEDEIRIKTPAIWDCVERPISKAMILHCNGLFCRRC